MPHLPDEYYRQPNFYNTKLRVYSGTRFPDLDDLEYFTVKRVKLPFALNLWSCTEHLDPENVHLLKVNIGF